jgi:beta-galactosidase beta subunit
MEDRYDHEIELKRIYIQMLEYNIHDECNNLINVHRRYRCLDKIGFHFQLLEKMN